MGDCCSSFFAVVLDPVDALRCYNYSGCFGSNCISKGAPVLNKNNTKLLEPYTLSVEEVLYLSLFYEERFYYRSAKLNSSADAESIGMRNAFYTDANAPAENSPLILAGTTTLDDIGLALVYISPFNIVKKIVQQFSNHDLSRICAYFHFRYLNWIIRPGLKYGSDFLLYAKRPGSVHSEYSVIVQHHSVSLEIVQFTGICRLTENVRKKLLLCILAHEIDLKNISNWIGGDDCFAISIPKISSLIDISSWSPCSSSAS